MSEEEHYNRQPTRSTIGRRKRSDVWDHFEQKAECKCCKALLCADKKHYEVTCPVRHPKRRVLFILHRGKCTKCWKVLICIESFLMYAPLGADAISKVGEVFRQLFTEYTNQVITETENTNQSNGMERANHVNEMDVSQQLVEQDNMNSQKSSTELNDYLQDETVPMDQKDFDILKWWKDNCHRYPTVARMARVSWPFQLALFHLLS
uniref:HAT-like transposase, putative n=1 Tax=Oryza sativa subsp. japonica TaxID=39947 RepID=Q2QRI0_ORYSJ|nr:hAT-like transposase, putative [Oryza sativa Japonica Group]